MPVDSMPLMLPIGTVTVLLLQQVQLGPHHACCCSFPPQHHGA